MTLDRLPWFERMGQARCLARLDNGDRCELRRHRPEIAHAHVDGEVTTRWSVLTWTDRTIDYEGRTDGLH